MATNDHDVLIKSFISKAFASNMEPTHTVKAVCRKYDYCSHSLKCFYQPFPDLVL